MIDCPFKNDDESCQHVNEGVGELVVISDSVCNYCVKTKEMDRWEGYAVRNTIWGQRRKRGLPVGEIPTTEAIEADRKRRYLAAKKAPPLPPLPKEIPIVADGEDRLELCEACDRWDKKRQRCGACSTCKDRTRPTAPEGKDCPIGLWRRPSPA